MIPRRLAAAIRKRFPFLFWPLSTYPHGVDLTPPSEHLDLHLAASRHSLRLQRYWWAARALEDEAKKHSREIVIVDLGCERGWMKRFVARSCHAHWIGLDGNLSHPSLAASGYHETKLANFNEPLPLPDNSADVIVSLHVFEHLADPTFTAREVARVLRAGGLFLVGTPVGCPPAAAIRTMVLRARARAGKNRHWGHLQKFSPAAWGRVCQAASLRIQFLTGSHLVRFTGFPLENWKWWIRLNQAWGGLFPSLGQEIYIAARKASPECSRQGLAQRLFLRFDWLAPIAAIVAVVWAIHAVTDVDPHFLADDIALHQDGNDVFKWCSMAGLNNPAVEGNVEQLPDIAALDRTFSQYEKRGLDLHVVIRAESVPVYLQTPSNSSLRVADEWMEGGRKYLVLSQEPQHVALSMWREGSPG